MAEPQARSYSQILGDMVAGFLARKRLPKLKAASPVLTVLEAAAQSDVRATQDVFAAVNARSLDRNSGGALDRIGNSEDIARRTELAANGLVTFSDTSFAKLSTRISPAKAAPIVGSTVIYLVDGTDWPATGSVYLGRDTGNYEGPLAYTSLVDSGSYWSMTLSSPTQRFHQLQEGVVRAQGGDRTIPAGQQVSTPQGQSTTPVAFTTLFSAIIPDGETSVEGVFVVCSLPGSVGNVPQEAISAVASPPFAGCAVVNPSGFVTGRDTESDNDYRDRIKAERANRSKATDFTLQVKATGVASDEDSRRVVSASIVRAENEPVTLYIDDGTGYEERSDAVALEPLAESALGGEKSFQLAFRPVAKAYVQTLRTAPFELTSDSHLAVVIGGVAYDHYFEPTSFRSLASVSAHEIVSSINANPNVPMNARTADGGTKVVIFATSDVNEDIQVTTPVSGDDANDALGFGVNRVDTLKLYKNDRLLNKDGVAAAVSSNPISTWSVLSGTEDLTVAVDGTPAFAYTFTAQDFIDAGTGFTAMGVNTAAAWAAVLNAKIPGITAVAGGDTVILTSNSDRSSRARIVISAGTLTTKGMFDVVDVVGKDADYTMNRNTAELRLKTGLAAGDSLTAGSFNTRAFLESATIAPVTLSATGNLWFVPDGDAEKITVGVNTTDTYDLLLSSSGSWGERWHLSADVGTPFKNVTSGDWMIVWDTGFPTLLRGIWRVAEATTTVVKFDTPVTGQTAVLNFTFANVNIRFVRTLVQPQNVQIAAGANYTAQAFATAINAGLTGAVATVYRTTKLRTKTRSFALGGDIALVAVDTEGAKVGLTETTTAIENLDGHLASVEAANSELGNTDFAFREIVAQSTGLNDATAGGDSLLNKAYDKFLVGEKATNVVSTTDRWGNNQAFSSMIASVTIAADTTLTTRRPSLQKWAVTDTFYLANPYALGPSDDLTVVIDQDTTTKRFLTKMYRQLQGTGATYGSTNTFVDDDNAGLSLTQAFGLGYDFNDFAVFMRARVLTHSADAGKRILWRWKRMGPDGNQARIRYVYPTAPSSPVAVLVDNMPATTTAFPTANAFNLISVSLPSDAQKTGYSVRSSTKIGYGSSVASGIDAITLVVGFAISSAQRAANVTTLTLTMPSGLYAMTDHNLQIGDQVFVNSNDANYTSGLKTITARTTTTVAYADVAANFGPTANIGTLSNDGAVASFSSATPTPIAVGDIVRLDDSTSLPALIRNRSIRITHVGAQFIQGFADSNYAGTQNTTVTWATVGDATKLKFYGLLAASSTATAIAAAVNALGDSCPVTATVTGTGTGQVLLASREEALSEDPLVEYVQFADGINWVSSTTSPGSMAGNYQLTFKAPITAGLVSNSDWANEEVRLVPITAADVVQWLNTPAIAGLFAVASVETSSNGHKPQIASLTPGTNGSVHVQGGLANDVNAAIAGAGIPDASGSPAYSSVSILKADADGFRAGNYVRLANADVLAKTGLISSTTALTSIAANGTVTLSAGPALHTVLGNDAFITIMVRREGRYMCYWGVDGSTAPEGSWVTFSGEIGPALSAPNCGTFRIVRADSTAVWVENDNGVDQSVALATWTFFKSDSLMPGDQLSISSSAWGAANQGLWTVESVTSPTVFKLDTSARAMTASGAVAALGATEAAKFVVTEGVPHVAVKRIHAIAPNATDATLVDVKFDTPAGVGSFNESVGTVMTALDKLGFSTSIVPGLDGYRYGTGLIGEVNRVIYGDPRDRATYPGVAGAGVKVNISGPLVKRLSVSLAVRIRLGVIPSDVVDRVRAAVSSVINDAGIGNPIAISSLVTAAGSVNGVAAVSVISPAYSSGNDLIAIQPFEKALILDAEQDISVSIVGE